LQPQVRTGDEGHVMRENDPMDSIGMVAIQIVVPRNEIWRAGARLQFREQSAPLFRGTTIMAKRTRGAGKRGRPRTTGSGIQVGMRWQRPLLDRMDRWAKRHCLSRPEAIRRLIELGLATSSNDSELAKQAARPRAVDQKRGETETPLTSGQALGQEQIRPAEQKEEVGAGSRESIDRDAFRESLGRLGERFKETLSKNKI
jgi:hypothetical protein